MCAHHFDVFSVEAFKFLFHSHAWYIQQRKHEEFSKKKSLAKRIISDSNDNFWNKPEILFMNERHILNENIFNN